MGYTAWSVVFGEQPTAAKWNQLGENDAGFKDGTNIDANAILNAHIPDAELTAEKLGMPISFKVRRTTNQSINNVTITRVDFQTEEFDRGSNYDNATNYRFTAPHDGDYHFDANIEVDAAGTILLIYLYVNGVLESGGHGNYSHTASDDNKVSISDLVTLSASDYVDIRIYHNAGVARSLLGDAAYRTWFGGHLIGRTD